ncbi:MAG TPA: hypothetical protein VFN94_07320 [Nitrospiria bacterium]|nr:hypothetical protein [Nitrospiria bacterium]
MSEQRDRVTLVALALFVAVFAFGDYGLGFEQWEIHWWADMAWTMASLLTGLQCLRAAKHQRGQIRTAWVFFGAACLSWFPGMLHWDYQELVLRQVTPFPALSDIGFMLFAPLCMAGMVWYRAEAPSTQVTLKQICNLGIVASAIAVAVPVILSASIQASTESRMYLGTAGPIPYFTWGRLSSGSSVFGCIPGRRPVGCFRFYWRESAFTR